MEKLSRRTNFKPPRSCIFCGRGAEPGNKMTGEHLWSHWLTKDKLLPKFPEHFEYKKIIDGKRGKIKSEFNRTRQGSPTTKKIKVVCSICNSGWMSEMETSVRPVLVPLILGEKILLDEEKCKILSRWIMLKIFVLEQNSYVDHPADPIFSQADRTAFKNHKTVPDGCEVRIGLQAGQQWVSGVYRYTGGLGFSTTFPPPPIQSTKPKNLQSVTWGIGKLLVHFTGFTDPLVRSKVVLSTGAGPLRCVWPLAHQKILWPPPYFVADDWIFDLAGALTVFCNSDSVIRVDNPTHD